MLTSRDAAFGPCALFPAWDEMNEYDYYLTPEAQERASAWVDLDRRIEEGIIASQGEDEPN